MAALIYAPLLVGSAGAGAGAPLLLVGGAGAGAPLLVSGAGSGVGAGAPLVVGGAGRGRGPNSGMWKWLDAHQVLTLCCRARLLIGQ